MPELVIISGTSNKHVLLGADDQSIGVLGSDRWQVYTWKNELQTQANRSLMHFAEYLNDAYDGTSNPFHMFERSFILCGFIIRRMSETRLITDALRDKKIHIRCFNRRKDAEVADSWRGYTGPRTLEGYAFEKPQKATLSVQEFGDEVLHASQLAIAYGFRKFADGILLASDKRYKKRLLHITPEEFKKVVELVLHDQIKFLADGDSALSAEGDVLCVRT